MEEHSHGPDGRVIISAPEPEAEVAEAVETEAVAAVEIAKIESDTEIALAKIGARVEEGAQETEIDALKAEIRGMREILDRLVPPAEPEPESAPEPVIVQAPIDDDDDMAPPEAEHEHEAPRKRKVGLGMW